MSPLQFLIGVAFTTSLFALVAAILVVGAGTPIGLIWALWVDGWGDGGTTLKVSLCALISCLPLALTMFGLLAWYESVEKSNS